MSSQYNTPMTLQVVTETKTASGFRSRNLVNGTILGAAVSTVSPYSRRVNGDVDLDAVIVQATVRNSTVAQDVSEGDYVAIDGDTFRVSGIGKGSYDRKEITFILRQVQEVS